MKIEMGESLFYSWLRHVKECQIAQNNWKVSPAWGLKNVNKLQQIYDDLKNDFENRYGYNIFKKADLNQTIRQAECDAIGIALNDGQVKHYAVDVAYHRKGLDYGGLEVTTCTVVKKCIRNALCLYGYFDAKEAEIVFASPKIGERVLDLLPPAIDYLNTYFQNAGMKYTFKLLYGDAFFNEVIDPIRIVSGQVEDTAELFMRSYQLLDMFRQSSFPPVSAKGTGKKGKNAAAAISILQTSPVAVPGVAAYDALLVGTIAKTVFRRMLESGLIPDEEIEKLLDLQESKVIFGLTFPILTETRVERCYADPLEIKGKKYYLCNQWKVAHKQKLIDWIKAHPEVEEYIYSLDAAPEDPEDPEDPEED